MPATTQKALIREMTPDELQEHSDQLYDKCNGNSLLLSAEEQQELLACARNHFQQTGEPLKTLHKLY